MSLTGMIFDIERFERRRGNRLLREDVARILRHRDRFDLPREHPFGGDGHVQHIAAVRRKEHRARHLAHLVPRAPDALQTAGGRRRRLDLDHQIDGAHVDARFEA